MASFKLEDKQMRLFETGATRNLDIDKLDYEGFLSPLVIQRFAEYMHKHRQQLDGSLRASDNWQLGLPKEACMKSGYRHFMDWWLYHDGYKPKEPVEEALCALIFNTQSYLLTLLKERGYHLYEQTPSTPNVSANTTKEEKR